MPEFTIGKIIDAFRESLRQTSDDSVYTDEYLYYIINASRAFLIKNDQKDNGELSPWAYQRFCIKLCPSTFIECNCEPFDMGCVVYRSENPIPEPIWDNANSIINVSELWGDPVYAVRESTMRLLKYRKHKSSMYYLIGALRGEHYLYVISNKTPPRYLKIEGVFQDPSEIDEASCQEPECPRPTGNGFPLSIDKHTTLFKIAMEMIGIPMKMPEDRSNNADSTVPDLKI